MLSSVFIVISIILSFYKSFSRKVLFLNIEEILELSVNSNIELDKLRKESEIGYSGNYLIVKDEHQKIEIDNKSTYKLLKCLDSKLLKNERIQGKLLDVSTKDLFNDLMSMLWGAS